MGERPKGLAPHRGRDWSWGWPLTGGGEAPWGAVGALWHKLRVTGVPECRVRLLVGARPKGLALPSWAGLELGMGSYRVGESAVGRGGSTVAHATRVAQMSECRMRLLVALARARQGARGGPQALWGLLSGSPWLSHRAQPRWAMSQTGRLRQGQTQRHMVVARRRKVWTARAAVHWVGMGDDAGPPSGEGQWKEGSFL